MWCTLDADGYPQGIFQGPAEGNPNIVWMKDDDPKVIARLAGDTPQMRANTKIGLIKDVDDEAERLRLKLATPGAGQAMEYQETQAEADRALTALAADPNAELNPLDYPMLAASVGVDIDPTTHKPSTDIAGSARSVSAVRMAWRAAASAIREARLKGKAAIEAAATAPDARAAFNAIQWPDLG